MTSAEMHERGSKICRKLTQEVAALAPSGIGRWPTTWDIVAESDADFMIALSRWEADPTDEAKERVRATYGAVLSAWQTAVAEFEREGDKLSLLSWRALHTCSE